MTKFLPEEIEFLKKELGLTEDKIKNFTADEWRDMHMHDKIADIAIDEAFKGCEISMDYEMTDRERIALQITDKSLKELGIV